MGEAKLTQHSKMRAKERLGIKKKSFQRQANRALEFGLVHSDFKGRFKKFLDALYFKYKTAGAVRVYGEHVYLFTTEDILITVFHVPTKFKRLALKLGRKKNGIKKSNETSKGIPSGETI